MKSKALFAMVALACASFAATAQTTSGMAAKGPGVAGAVQTTKATAKIVSIDKATRTVVIKGPQGNEVPITAGPEVKNFAQMKVGDEVNVEYVEAITLELKKGGKALVARTEDSAMGSAKPGEKPAVAAGRHVKVTGDVIGADPATQVVTVKGPKRTIDLRIKDPEQFKLIKVGDQIEANYVEALAISVEPAAKPAAEPKKEPAKKPDAPPKK
jgi:Cu/Ag efflux protein CusF